MVSNGAAVMVALCTVSPSSSYADAGWATPPVTGRLEPGIGRSGDNGTAVLLPRAGCQRCGSLYTYAL